MSFGAINNCTMKTINALLIVFSLALASNAQSVKENDVPTAVRNAFAAKYPQSKAEKWVKEENNYEAELTLKGKGYEAAFNANGKWIETEREIKSSALPQAVKDGLAKSKYGTWTIKEAVEIESPEHKVVYELELASGKEKVALYFTPDGKIVKEEKD